MLSVFVLAMAADVPAKTPPSAPSPRVTLQQKFDGASDDVVEGRCAEAIATFRSIEKDPRVKPGSVPAGAIALRKGLCLARTGVVDEGEAAIVTGMPILEKAGGEYTADVANGWMAIGDLALRRYDYAYATKAYKRALANTTAESRLSALIALSKSTTFDGTPEALSYSEEALRLLAAAPKPSKDLTASLHTLHARTLMNQSKAAEAYKEMKQALALSGGLTTAKVSLNEVALRSDLAMAALQNGKKDDARLYLAYTGAGRISQSPFASAQSMDPPLCGSETGLRPEDSAVVEFSLTQEGTVGAAQTVFSRGDAQVAAAFGKAVREWQWDPQDIAKIPAFYRLLTRVELRCSNALGDRPGIVSPMRARFVEWAQAVLSRAGITARSDPDLAKLLNTTSDPIAPETKVAAWALRANDERRTSSEIVAYSDQALAAAPPQLAREATSWIRLMRLAAAKGLGPARKSRQVLERYRADLLAMAAEPAIAQDPLAADTMTLLAARLRGLSVSIQDTPLLTRVAQDERLAREHPLRQLAWLELADRAAAAQDFASAQSAFAQSGLSEEQCSLLSLKPIVRKTGADGNDYPTEALRMGFEGWVRLEFDITGNGSTTNARPIAAYPPFVFVDAALGMSRGVQYRASYRPASNNACSANRETFRFIIPTNH